MKKKTRLIQEEDIEKKVIFETASKDMEACEKCLAEIKQIEDERIRLDERYKELYGEIDRLTLHIEGMFLASPRFREGYIKRFRDAGMQLPGERRKSQRELY